MATKRKDRAFMAFIFYFMTCFIINTSCSVLHYKLNSIAISNTQKAYEKYENLGKPFHLILGSMHYSNSFTFHQQIVPHSAFIVFLLYSIPVKKTCLQNIAKCMYLRKNLCFVRFTFLHLPKSIVLASLYILSLGSCCISEYLLYHDALVVNISAYISFGNEKSETDVNMDTPNVKKASPGQARRRSRTSLGKRFRTEDDGRSPSPPPNKKSNKKKNDGTHSPPCSIWQQTGRDPHLASKHRMDHPYSASVKAEKFSKYLSFDSTVVSLSDESSICMACYRDANDNCSSDPPVPPRWHKLKNKKRCPSDLHCTFCHQEWTDKSKPSPCKSSSRIVSSSTWTKGQSIQFWNQVMRSPPHSYKAQLRESSRLCQRHVMELQRIYSSKTCLICHQHKTESWTLFSMISKEKRTMLLGKLPQPPNLSDLNNEWLCKSCIDTAETKSDDANKDTSNTSSMTNTNIQVTETQESRTDPSAAHDSNNDNPSASSMSNTSHTMTTKPLNDILDEDSTSTFMKTNHSSIFLSTTIPKINTNGYFWRKDLLQNYKEQLKKESRSSEETKSMQTYFEYYISSVFKKSSDFSLYKTKNGTVVVYENQKYTEFSIIHIINLLEENSKLKSSLDSINKSGINESDIQKMFDEQTKLFSDNISSLDFRNLDNDDDVLLCKNYIHKPLFEFFERILKISSSENTGEGNEHLKKKTSQYFRILMAVGTLCNVKNRKALLMQTVIGLVMYASGLRDSGFHVLNRFGLSSSIKYIRRIAKVWSLRRRCIDEINPRHMWRITFDNLNFSRKYAKTSMLGGEKSGRMLDLLTGQVSHSSSDPNSDFNAGPIPDFVPETSQQFRIDENEEEYNAYNAFLEHLTSCQEERNMISTEDFQTTLLKDLENKMPDFTPNTKDTITYATVKEAKSSSIHDIASYLHDMKTELKIGQDGYPSKVILGGDQQTYSLLKNLIKKYPDTFNYIIPMIGDWHLLKLASECIKCIIWNGGLHDLGIECGHLKDVVQWRDIHNLLLAVHESLLANLIKHHPLSGNERNLSSFIKNTTSTENEDQIASFWTCVLNYLNVYVAYYFSIRSGNFALRNACLPKLAELFFAYNHGNYQTLVCEHILDLHRLPENVKREFSMGRWTMSITGNKFENVALDEGHEGVINKRLKMLTSRASEYRTVTLSNFMAYLDKFIENLRKQIFKRHVDAAKRKKSLKTPVNYLKKISPVIAKVSIFPVQHHRRLHNIFIGEKAPQLDDGTISDLLNFGTEGKSRFQDFVTNRYTDSNQKKTVAKRKLATFTKKQSTQFKEKQKANKVTLLLKRAYAELQKAGHYIEKTLAFPLALCDEEGQMRDRHKSKIMTHLKKNDQFSSMFVKTLPFTMSSSEVIIDFLKFLHEPTPPDITTYRSLAVYYWRNVILKYGFNRGASVVTIVVDKAQFLSPIRQIIHTERKKGKGAIKELDVNISDEKPALHGTKHAQALQNPIYKQNLIHYLKEQFISLADNLNGTLIIDCIHKIPIIVRNGSFSECEERSNTKGEADNAIFIHVKKSDCNNIVIVASDTDIPMYGIASLENDTMSMTEDAKNIVVEKNINEDYVWLNKALLNFRSHENVASSSLKHSIGHAVLALYLLAGSDYVSNFFGITCEMMICTFLKYIDFISTETDPLLHFNNHSFEGINYMAFLRLLCCVYLEKYKRLTSHVASSPVELFETFKKSSTNMNAELTTLLQWLDYDEDELKSKSIKITNTTELAALTRRVSFFMNHGSKTLYNMILPSDTAIKLHCQRATFVMKIVLDNDHCSSLYLDYEQYGWVKLGDTVVICWDENFEEEEKKLNKKRQLPISKCSCSKTGCTVDGPGCKNCCKSCRPCNAKCACQREGLCKNPHNNGGYCSKCKEQEEIEEKEEMELEQADSEGLQHLQTLPFDDINAYFDQQSNSYMDIPATEEKHNESESELSSDAYDTDDSDLDI